MDWSTPGWEVEGHVPSLCLSYLVKQETEHRKHFCASQEMDKILQKGNGRGNLPKARQAFTLKKISAKESAEILTFSLQLINIYISACVCVCVSMSNPPAQAWYADHSIESVKNIIQTYRPRNDKDFTRGIYTHRTLKPNKETLYHLFKDYIIYVFHHLTEERKVVYFDLLMQQF